MARTENVDVKVEGKTIGTAEVDVFESITEACDKLSEDKVLKLINAKVKADTTNGVRMKFLNDTPMKQISRAMRDVTKNKLTADEARAKVTAPLDKLGVPASASPDEANSQNFAFVG